MFKRSQALMRWERRLKVKGGLKRSYFNKLCQLFKIRGLKASFETSQLRRFRPLRRLKASQGALNPPPRGAWARGVIVWATD